MSGWIEFAAAMATFLGTHFLPTRRGLRERLMGGWAGGSISRSMASPRCWWPSSISRFEAGYVQNAAATPGCTQRIEARALAGYRGHRLCADDALRARAIEMLMCDFSMDLQALDSFGDAASALAPTHAAVCERFRGLVALRDGAQQILPEGRPLARMIASQYDAYMDVEATFSKAS